MAGTVVGGKKAAVKNKERFGENFYSVIGRKGGQNGNTGGFAAQIPCRCNEFPYKHFKVQCAGKKGGRKSRRNSKGADMPDKTTKSI